MAVTYAREVVSKVTQFPWESVMVALVVPVACDRTATASCCSVMPGVRQEKADAWRVRLSTGALTKVKLRMWTEP